MKKSFLIAAFALFTLAASAQAQEQKPQINVNGEGKVRVVPDQARISVTVETKGSNATDVKKQNDATTEKVIQYIKKSNLPKNDVMTQRVSLSPQYDTDKKKYSYIASQTIEIFLRNLDQYDALMGGLVDSGINRINSVNFESSKMAQYESEARKAAIADAKHKAEDYVSVLGQKVGKALTINDNTQIRFPQPVMYMAKSANADVAEAAETLAIGEIVVTATVSATFYIE